MQFKKNILKLCFRGAVFAFVLYSYLFYPDFIDNIVTFRFFSPFSLTHILWAVLVGEMVIQLFPRFANTTGCGKVYKKNYSPTPYDEYKLLKYTMRENERAALTMLLWLCANAICGLLFLMNILTYKELILLSMFYYVCDLICVLFWCPFQTFINKNRCCVTCRIYNWGFFMVYTPFLFLKGFFMWSLFFCGLVLLIFWEYMHSKYPERFWEGGNKSLRCDNCTDKMCVVKKPLVKK